VNNHFYIGSAIDIRKRQRLHQKSLDKGKHHSIYLQRAYNLYGVEAFTFEILELVEKQSDLLLREQHYLDTLLPHYNILPKAGSPTGRKYSMEARKRMSETRKGQKGNVFTLETRQMMSETRKGKKIKPPSPETKQKLSLALQGRKISDETRLKMSKAKQQVPIEERRRRSAEMNEIQRQRRLAGLEPPEIAEKWNINSAKGRVSRPHTEETRKKLSEIKTGKSLPPSSVAKREATRKANRLAKEETERAKNLQRFSEMEPMVPIDPSKYKPMSLWDKDWNEDTAI
jgi:group I intron endonuclease